ncbi:MAG TPA: cysteine--tRNA ligase [Chloroflexi bacterium]|nr:cysteine--tRNA ligase [Chloroflexota bacterium]
MSLRLYSTLTRKKEDFETIEPGKVRMYVCGPTVYDKAHIGHAMSAIVFDIVRRYLMYRGYEVTYVMNFTDVDDKIIKRANESGEDSFQLGERLIADYQQNLVDLNVLPASIHPRATQEIDGIIAMIEELIAKGAAYHANGDVYFRVDKDDDYGKLAHRNLDDMQAGARIEVNPHKENPMDFALWKTAKPGEPAWDSPWGKGRPGWHIECSAMNRRHLGDQIDIHGGGNDLIFPHHENEIAQTETITGKPFARYWMHNGMLQLNGEAMSKSTGNMIRIEEFLAEHDADVMRMMILNASYRGPLTYTDEVVAMAEKAIERLKSAFKPALPGAKGLPPAGADALTAQGEQTRANFIAAMDDDINTAGALGHLFELVKAINVTRDEGAQDEQLADAQAVLRELTEVLGLRLQDADKAGQGDAAKFIDLLVALRSEVRARKLFDLSDKIRGSLKELGVAIEDSREGSSWHFE